MKISIITPSYNQGQFVEECILSVLNQDYSDFEHIIIDNCSTDNTIEILKKYPHLKWISEPDEGQSDAINKGFKMASGDILGWLNSDDFYLPNVFTIVEKELSNSNVDAIYANFRFINSKGIINREMITQKASRCMSLFYCYIPSTTFFFKRKIVDSNLFIDKNFHIAMDKEFFAHILFSGYKIKKVDAFFAHFRWHENNKSIDNKNIKKIRYKEGLTIFNRYSVFLLPDNNLGKSIYKMFMSFCGLYRTICRKLNIGIYDFKT